MCEKYNKDYTNFYPLQQYIYAVAVDITVSNALGSFRAISAKTFLLSKMFFVFKADINFE